MDGWVRAVILGWMEKTGIACLLVDYYTDRPTFGWVVRTRGFIWRGRVVKMNDDVIRVCALSLSVGLE